MIVRNSKQIEGTDRDVKFKEGTSLRLLLASDRMGFSVHKTIIPKGEIGRWHYKNHLEACYCISGWAIVTDLATGEQHDITADTIYALDKHDNHQFEAIEDTVLISIFNPPCTGKEIHLPDGSYEIKREAVKIGEWDA